MSMITKYTVMSAPARPRPMSNDLAILGSATATIVEFNGTRADARAMPRTTDRATGVGFVVMRKGR